jgi:hypothetical protein
MAFEDEVTQVLREAFPGADLIEFGKVPGLDKVGGVVEWSGFGELTHLDRQNRLWHALRARFSQEQLGRVSMILTFTPREMQAMVEG